MAGCRIGDKNAIDPEAPEYQKGYKDGNNAGCGGSCGDGTKNLSTDNTTTTLTEILNLVSIKHKYRRRDVHSHNPMTGKIVLTAGNDYNFWLIGWTGNLSKPKGTFDLYANFIFPNYDMSGSIRVSGVDVIH